MKIPDSIKPGIPKLPSQIPDGWVVITMDKVFIELNRKVKVEDEAHYDLVTVKRSRGGVQKRERLIGDQISVKSQFFIKENDFLISRRQIVHGACGIVPKELDGSIVSNEYLVLKVKSEFDLNFLKYYSHSQYFQQTCFHSSIGVHVEKMIFKPHWWYKFKHLIPPLKEQQKIADILGTWDHAISINEKLVNKLILRNKGLAQQLLTGEKRLHGFDRDWLHLRISDIANSQTILNKDNLEIEVLSCTKYDGLVRSLEYFGRQVFGDDLSKYKIVPRGSFAYATNHIEEGSIGYQNLIEKGLVSPMYTVFKTKPEINDEFFFRLLKTDRMIYAYQSNTSGSIARRGGLRWNDFSTLHISIPALEEQVAINSVLLEADKELRLYKQQLGILKEQKKALMQKLLTGKTRVKA